MLFVCLITHNNFDKTCKYIAVNIFHHLFIVTNISISVFTENYNTYASALVNKYVKNMHTCTSLDSCLLLS